MQKPIFLSIKSKIIFVSLFLSLTTLFSVSLISYISADNLLRERVSDQLISESTGRGAAARSLVDTMIEQTRLMLTNSAIQQVVDDINSGPAPTEEERARNRAEFRSELESFQRVVRR